MEFGRTKLSKNSKKWQRYSISFSRNFRIFWTESNQTESIRSKKKGLIKFGSFIVLFYKVSAIRSRSIKFLIERSPSFKHHGNTTSQTRHIKIHHKNKDADSTKSKRSQIGVDEEKMSSFTNETKQTECFLSYKIFLF